MTTFGLVLGAGGAVGGAYHAGTLTALQEAGVDARDAAVVVGTSAGAGTGAVLRAGFPPTDLANRVLGNPLSAEALSVIGDADTPSDVPMRPRLFSRPPLPSSVGMAVRNWWDPAKVMVGLLPHGTVPTDGIGDSIDRLYKGRRWPDDPLWICAIRLRDGELQVFGRDEVEAGIGTAVRASSAIPGFFEPVRHDGEAYVDGGLRSPTNADLLADLALDAVIVISPMSATGAGIRAAGISARAIHARRLGSEVAALRRRGVEVVTVQPTVEDVSVMGRNAMDFGRRSRTVEQALVSARLRFAEPRIAGLLSNLA